jgi:hypothetical protein
MTLLAVLAAVGAIVGASLRYPYLIIAVFAYLASEAMLHFVREDPVGLLNLVFGIVAIQVGYVAGVLAATHYRDRRNRRH